MIQNATWTWIPKWWPTPLPSILFQNLVSLCVSHVALQSKKSTVNNITHTLVCCLFFSYGIIYLPTSTSLSSSNFYLCGYRKALVGRSWRCRGVSHTRTGDHCIINAHLNLPSPFFSLCIVSVYGTASVVSYGDIRLPLLCIKGVMSLNTYFHKQDSKHVVITSRQRTLCWKNVMECVFLSWTLWKSTAVVAKVAFPISPDND